MSEAPKIYGYDSVPWTLPAHLEHCREAVLEWGSNWVNEDDLMLEDVWRMANDHVQYMSEPKGEDRWQKPHELLRSPSITFLRGDCEDFAMLFGARCLDLGYPKEDIFVTVYHDKLHPEINQSIHAVCVVRTQRGNSVLDQRSRVGVLKDDPDPMIAPIFSIRFDGAAFLHGTRAE